MYRADPHGNQAGLLWGKGFYGEHLRRVLGHLKRALGMEQRLTLQESYDLLLLAEAIIDFGRMVHAYDRLSAPQVIVEVAELEHRFRETKRNMRNALLLLEDMGCAEPAHRYGYWKLDLAGFSARKDLPAA